MSSVTMSAVVTNAALSAQEQIDKGDYFQQVSETLGALETLKNNGTDVSGNIEDLRSNIDEYLENDAASANPQLSEEERERLSLLNQQLAFMGANPDSNYLPAKDNISQLLQGAGRTTEPVANGATDSLELPDAREEIKRGKFTRGFRSRINDYLEEPSAKNLEEIKTWLNQKKPANFTPEENAALDQIRAGISEWDGSANYSQELTQIKDALNEIRNEHIGGMFKDGFKDFTGIGGSTGDKVKGGLAIFGIVKAAEEIFGN